MNKKILIIDDDVGTLRLVEGILSSNGFNVIKASDGEEGLAKVCNEAPDLVILDVIMPEINGYDVCYELRFNNEYEKVPIILLTVRPQELGVELSERVNIGYVSKPIDADLLLEKINSLLN
ncbi:MAG: response regulator [Candidatus Omnitrophica bacterium]|nr:response regulator [Candidatus Omnitrophota bacterium]